MMITRDEAIAKIKEIQHGQWDRNDPVPPKGKLAASNWDSGEFLLGMECGAIVMLMQLFALTTDDV